MIKRLLFVLMVVQISACTLSGKQELILNKQLNKYLNAINSGNTLVAAGLSHPKIVSYYHQLGDSLFLAHFNSQLDSIKYTLENPIYLNTKFDGNRIEQQVVVTKHTYKAETQDTLYAISENNGNSWFMIQQCDYLNKKINFGKKLF